MGRSGDQPIRGKAVQGSVTIGRGRPSAHQRRIDHERAGGGDDHAFDAAALLPRLDEREQAGDLERARW